MFWYHKEAMNASTAFPLSSQVHSGTPRFHRGGGLAAVRGRDVSKTGGNVAGSGAGWGSEVNELGLISWETACMRINAKLIN